MKRIIQFVQKERLYILILIFVLLFNAVMIFHGESKSKEKARPGVTSTMSRKEAMAKKFEENLAKRKEMEIVLHKNDRLMVLFGICL